MTSTPVPVHCLTCRVPMDHRLFKEHLVAGCPRCHSIALAGRSLSTSVPPGVVSAIATSAFIRSPERCECGEATESAQVEWQARKAQVSRCTRCLNYHFGADAAQLLFSKKPAVPAPSVGTAWVWLDWFDFLDWFDWH